MPSISYRLVLTFSVLLAFRAVAQPASPQAAGVTPNTVQRGHAAELTLNGAGFAGATGVSVPQSAGITAELVAAEGATARVKVTAAPDAALGQRELRLVGPNGVSNPLTLHVSQYPPVFDAEPNNDRAAPQDVQLPAVLLGAINAPGDVDAYRFEAKKGQRLVFEVSAAREGYKTDAVLALYNAAGREVAGSNDHFGNDPFIAYQAAEDGAYTLAVHDLKYQGGAGYDYRVTAGAIPFVEAIFPISAQSGKPVEVKPVGYNLGESQEVTVSPGEGSASVEVRPAGATEVSNARTLELLDVPVVAEAEPNDAADQGNPVTLPAAINGRIERPGDADTYRFTLEQPMKVAVEAYASRFASPVDPILTLRDAAGKVVARNDDAAGFDARIVADLQPGAYSVTIQDLLYGGSASHVYRISVGPDAPPPPNFALRFQPDAIRISRGGHARAWAEVVRAGGYAGDVTLTVEGLPEGVTIDPQPATLGASTSGLFTFGASPEAKLGTFPVQLVATGTLGDKPATRHGSPQIGNTVVRQAYLTVFEPAPFKVRPVDLTPQQIAVYSAELDAVDKKLTTPTPEFAAKAAEWEKSLGAGPVWIALETVEAKGAQGTNFAPQPDGSLLATGGNPVKDTYTITAKTDLKGITAVKLETFADDDFPANGPGRAINGNFVLTTITLAASSLADEKQSAPVTFASAFADYSQPGLNPDKSFDPPEPTNLGWAVGNEFGKDHFAAFQPAAPIAGYDGGTKLTFALIQDFGGQHTIGRLRLSATTSKEPKAGPTLSAPVAAVLAVPADQRTQEQKDTLTRYFMARAPELDSDRARAGLLRSIVGPAREIAALEAQLAADHPQADASQAQWEQVVRNPQLPKLSTWHAAGPFPAGPTMSFDAVFGPERQLQNIKLDAAYGPLKIKWVPHEEWVDGVITNLGSTDNSATYLYRTITVDVPRQLELSLGSDDGIKVWHNGKQVLANNVGRPAMPGQEKVTLALLPGPEANHLLIKIANIGGLTGYYFKPAEGAAVPQAIATLLALPADQRNTEQKAAIRAHYRSIDPTLKPALDRLKALKTQFGAAFPPVAKRKEMVALSVAIDPQPGFDGPVTVTLEGFTPGRDPATGMPAPISNQIDLKPATLSASNSLGILSLTPKEQAELATRNVVLRAEAKVGDVTWVQYSPAFPLTVKE